MAHPTRLSVEADRFLPALRPICDLVDEHLLINASGRTSLAKLLRHHCEISLKITFFGLGPYDFQTISHGLAIVIQNVRVVEKDSGIVGDTESVLTGAGEVVLGALYAAENYRFGIATVRVLAKDLKEALENLKVLCSRLIRRRRVRSKILYRRRPETCSLIQCAQLPPNLEDLLEEDELTDPAA